MDTSSSNVLVLQSAAIKNRGRHLDSELQPIFLHCVLHSLNFLHFFDTEMKRYQTYDKNSNIYNSQLTLSSNEKDLILRTFFIIIIVTIYDSF